MRNQLMTCLMYQDMVITNFTQALYKQQQIEFANIINGFESNNKIHERNFSPNLKTDLTKLVVIYVHELLGNTVLITIYLQI